uniref:DoxX family protein n=1 Tax=Heterorhabditis bacteriophora TaxID=37862 RepID=A0A1I7WAP8_HETBA
MFSAEIGLVFYHLGGFSLLRLMLI